METNYVTFGGKMKKSKRLNQELVFLSNKKYFNLKDLMEEFEISKRTALRDIQDLEAMGLPFYVEEGRYGGYRLLKQNSMIPIYFNHSEIISIFFALKALKLVSDTPFEGSYPQIYKKLLLTLPKEQQQHILQLLDIVDYHHIAPVNISKHLSSILEAILELKVVELEYNQYQVLTKKLLVYDLFYRNGIWFCHALDMDIQKWGVYRCDCIESCNIKEEIKHSYTRADLKKSLQEHEESYRKISFRCRVNSFGKELFLRDSYPGMYLEEKEGLIFLFGAFGEEELRYMIHYFISFGKNIVVEEPQFLKESYRKELQEILDRDEKTALLY